MCDIPLTLIISIYYIGAEIGACTFVFLKANEQFASFSCKTLLSVKSMRFTQDV